MQTKNTTDGTPEQKREEQQALALLKEGKLQKAEAVYRKIVTEGTKNPIVYENLAAICGIRGRYNELTELLKEALRINPNNPESYINLGNAFKEKGDLKSAIKSYSNAIRLKPSQPEAYYNLGIALKERGHTAAAILSYNNSIKLRPKYPEALNNLGNALQQEGRLTAAIDNYSKALELKPNHSEFYYNIGVAFLEKGDLISAINAYKNSIKLNPNYPEALNGLGIAFLEQSNTTSAITSHKNAIRLKPNYPEAHNNLGICLQEVGNPSMALASYSKAIKYKPNYIDAHLNSSLALLLLGDYKQGWEKYDLRAKTKKSTSLPHASPKCRTWNGEPLKRRSKLLLVSEQGLGDTLQFMRYARVLRDRGIDVSLCAQPTLHSLIQASGIDPRPLNPKQANKISEGSWIPLMSVPKHLEVNPMNPIATDPYIKATNELVNKWSKRLSTEKRPVVAINWQGNPDQEKANFVGRSIPLETFAPIIENINISFISIQKGYGSEQLETCSFKERFVRCQNHVNDTWDFLETAAIITCCDLVITSDTSMAHLAGGIGKNTWLLLKKNPEWRWGLTGETTFWYPSMRLFRQREQSNWDEVIQRVAKALEEQF